MTDEATEAPTAGRATIDPAPDDRAHALAVVSVLLALASAWHVLAAPISASSATQLLLAAGIAAVLVRPGRPAPLVALAVGILLTAWSEAPRLGNHWALAAFVALGILGAVASTARRGWDRSLLAERLLPVLRTCLIGFYAFAAFAKLNADFFDRTVSCGAEYFRETTDSLRLGALQAGGSAGIEWAAIIGTAAIELAIPVLLVWRRTRLVGVLVALVFHGVLALDRIHPFMDFSSLLAALFVTFLPVASLAAASRAVRTRIDATVRHGDSLPRAIRGLSVALPTVAVVGVATRELPFEIVVDLRWWAWQATSLALIVAVARHLRRDRPVAEPAIFAIRPWALAVVPLLVVANGLTPYLEVKTGYGWNMYANLRTVDGDSNHYLVRRTLPLTDVQADLVRIVSSDDRGLQGYADDDLLVPFRNLQAYLARHPDTALTYERAGRVHRVDRAGDVPTLVDAPPEWQQKLLVVRASDGTPPERCQTAVRPAN